MSEHEEVVESRRIPYGRIFLGFVTILIIGVVGFLAFRTVSNWLATRNQTPEGVAEIPAEGNRDGGQIATPVVVVPTGNPPPSLNSCPAVKIPDYVLSHEGGHLRIGWLPGPDANGIRWYSLTPITGEAKVYPSTYDVNRTNYLNGQAYDPDMLTMSNGETYDPSKPAIAVWAYPLDSDPVEATSSLAISYNVRYEKVTSDGTVAVFIVQNVMNTDRGPSGNVHSDLPNGIARITQAIAMQLDPESCILNGQFNSVCYEKIFTVTITPNCQ